MNGDGTSTPVSGDLGKIPIEAYTRNNINVTDIGNLEAGDISVERSKKYEYEPWSRREVLDKSGRVEILLAVKSAFIVLKDATGIDAIGFKRAHTSTHYTRQTNHARQQLKPTPLGDVATNPVLGIDVRTTWKGLSRHYWADSGPQGEPSSTPK